MIILKQFSSYTLTKTRPFVNEQFLISRRSMRLLAMSLGTSFILTLISIEQKALTFQQITVTDKKLHLTSTWARKLEHVVFFCSFVVSKNHLGLTLI